MAGPRLQPGRAFRGCPGKGCEAPSHARDDRHAQHRSAGPLVPGPPRTVPGSTGRPGRPHRGRAVQGRTRRHPARPAAGHQVARRRPRCVPRRPARRTVPGGLTPADAGPRTVPALRDALMDYRQITRLLGGHEPGEPPPLDMLGRHVADVWTSYQDSQFGQVTRDLPAVLAAAQLATREYTGDDQARAYGLLAMTYQAAAMTLTKVGETD